MDVHVATDTLPVVIAALEAATQALRQLRGGLGVSHMALTPSPPSSPSIAYAPTTTNEPKLSSQAEAIDTLPNSGTPRVVLALFDYTTLGLEPWRRRGYECHVCTIAPQHAPLYTDTHTVPQSHRRVCLPLFTCTGV